MRKERGKLEKVVHNTQIHFLRSSCTLMSQKNILKAFQDLGIVPEVLPDYYTPDLYAKRLMEHYDKRKASRIIFSSSIDYYDSK